MTGVPWDAAVDDTAWLAYRECLEVGWYDAVVADLGSGTWGGEAVGRRTADRPQGLQRMEPEVKDCVRAANQEVARAVEVGTRGRRSGG